MGESSYVIKMTVGFAPHGKDATRIEMRASGFEIQIPFRKWGFGR
jgi:hypothetical protein